MSVFAQLLEKEWSRTNMERITFTRESDDTYPNGQLFRHDWKSCIKSDGTIDFTILLLMYCDDMAIPFSSRDEMIKGMLMVQQLLSDLGLQMHVGKPIGTNDDGSIKYDVSKTEFTFYPPPCFFKDQIKTRWAIADHTSDNTIVSLSSDMETLSEEAQDERVSLEDELYDACELTNEVLLNGGRITSAKRFKYLGKIMTYNLRDDDAIDARIAAASKAMGALKHFFNKKQVSLYSKYLIFLAIPINLLLWGCESWAVRVDHVNKIERFIQRQMRKLLNINMLQVKDEHITREQIRERFHNMSSAQALIDGRKMQLLGKVIRSEVTSIARILLIAFIPNTRHIGRPLKCCREALHDSLCRLMLDVQEINIDRRGSLIDWYYDALCPSFWNSLIRHLKDTSLPVPPRPNPDASFRPRRGPRRRARQSNRDDDDNQDDGPVSPPRQQRQAPQPPTPPSPPSQQRRRRYREENVGRILWDSFDILGLDMSASFATTRKRYRQLARLYHPDQHHTTGAQTGLDYEQTTKHFQLIANAWEYLESKF